MIKVNEQKFDLAYHDPVRLIQKFDRYITESEQAVLICYKALERLKKEVHLDWALHRQNMLDSIITNDKQLRKKIKKLRGKE